MTQSYQSFHRLPVLNCEGNDSAANKDLKSLDHGHNVRVVGGDQNIEGNNYKKTKEPYCTVSTKRITKSVKAKNSKFKLRRKPKSHTDVKETLSFTSNYIKRLFHPHHTTDNNRKYRNQKKGGNQTNQIQVLFSSEAKKLRRECRNLNLDLIHDIYYPNINSYYENMRNKTCIENTNTKKQVNIKYCDVLKEDRENVGKTHAFNKVECLCNLSCSSNYDAPTKYKVVHFPNYDQTDTELEEINLARNYELKNIQTEGESPNFKKDEQVGASMSRVSVAQRGGGDAGTVSKHVSVSKESGIKNYDQEQDTALNKDCCQHFKTFLDPINIHENALYLAKVTLKYFIIGLVLIVWSPCIVTLYFCWLLTYPLRPRYGVTRNPRCRTSKKPGKRKSQVKRHVHKSKHNFMTDNTMQTCDNNCDNIWSFLLKGFNWAYKSIGVTFGALTSQDHSTAREEAVNKVRVMTSNPKKKYTLYYSRNKGWIMKAAKLNKNKTDERRLKEVHYRDVREPIDNRLRNSRCSCRVRSEKHLCDNNKNLLLATKYPCHRHLYKDISGLPVLIRQSNPILNSYISTSKMRPQRVRLRYKHSKLPVNRLAQRPVRTPEKVYKNNRLAQRSVKTPEKVYKNRHKAVAYGKKYETSHPIITFKNKILQYCNETIKNIKSVIDDVESEVFGDNGGCGELYIQTLRKRPWFCVYKKCPSFYPICLCIYKFYVNLFHFWLLLISACIWCPLLAFSYLCYAIFCGCL